MKAQQILCLLAFLEITAVCHAGHPKWYDARMFRYHATQVEPNRIVMRSLRHLASDARTNCAAENNIARLVLIGATMAPDTTNEREQLLMLRLSKLRAALVKLGESSSVITTDVYRGKLESDDNNIVEIDFVCSANE